MGGLGQNGPISPSPSERPWLVLWYIITTANGNTSSERDTTRIRRNWRSSDNAGGRRMDVTSSGQGRSTRYGRTGFSWGCRTNYKRLSRRRVRWFARTKRKNILLLFLFNFFENYTRWTVRCSPAAASRNDLYRNEDTRPKSVRV